MARSERSNIYVHQVERIEDLKTPKEKFIVEQLAQMVEPKDIIRKYAEAGMGRIDDAAVAYYRRTRGEVVRQLREKIMEASMDVPIANERIRLQRAEILYNQAQNITGLRDKVNTSLSVLDFAREETKESVPANVNMQFNQFNQLTNEQLIQKKIELERKIAQYKPAEVIDGQVEGI